MTNLERSAKKDTVGMIITVTIYAVGAASVPYIKLAERLGGGDELVWYLGFVFKILCSVLPIYLILQFGMKKMLTSFSGGARGLFMCIPALLVALDNFPFVPLIEGEMSFNGTIGRLFPYLLYCLSIGVMEETIFRGNLLPLFMYKFEHTKKGLFFAIISSSAVFGAMHLLNLFGGFSPAVFLQVGYSFLIGCMCSACLILSGNITVPVIVHALFDVGGFLSDSGFCTGTLWTFNNVLITAILSVLFAACIIAAFLKTDFSNIYAQFNLDEKPV